MKSRNQRGVAVVEVAITLLPFFVILMAVMEAGWFFYVQATLTHAAREGARMAVRPISQTNNVMNQDEVRAYVADFLRPIGVNCSSCILVTTDAPNVCADVPGCIPLSEIHPTLPQPVAKYIRVQIKVPYSLLTLSMFKSLQFDMKGEALMRDETSLF